MRNDRIPEFIQAISEVVGPRNLLIKEEDIKSYTEGIRIGQGKACCVVLPKRLLEFWEILEICVSFEKIIIIQAANTGLTGGSTPEGDNYDRDVLIINTLRLDKLILLNKGEQVLAFAGSTLTRLEDVLSAYNREPHSLIGSSCIGASIVGGICNNSGGNLVNRGPAYTELSLYAKINENGKLELVNHLDIELGNSPREILYNLENLKFSRSNLPKSKYKASDNEYSSRVRDITSNTPARFNADKRRLFEASGCAGKIAVFAVRLDTFNKSKQEQVFLIGTNDPNHFTNIRRYILTKFKQLPDMVEYMHRSFFDGADVYGKDTFLIIKYFGKKFIPKLFWFKKRLDSLLSLLSLSRKNYFDVFLHKHAELLPDHLPSKAREYRERFEHILIIKCSDSNIANTENMLLEVCNEEDFDYYKCSRNEGSDLLLHRYVAGIAPKRFAILNKDKSAVLFPLDVAMPRNCDNWHQIISEDFMTDSLNVFRMGHFLCMVFHWDFILESEDQKKILKTKLLRKLDSLGAKYPAEHNVGHLYFADSNLENFYKKIDPTNSFNSGIGKLSKNKFYE